MGCKLNFAESSGLADKFIQKGYSLVKDDDTADIYVINTCTVTATAEKKCRQIIKKCRKRNIAAKIAVIGCFSQLRPEEISKIEGVSYILGTADKHLLLDYIERDEKQQTISQNSLDNGFELNKFEVFYSYSGRTRSFLKIQDGCDNFCTYCAIPYARGRSRSASIEQILKATREIAALNVKEIVLTGVNIGDFGRKDATNFHTLLTHLIRVEGVERYRISSIEPDLLTDEIIHLLDSGKIMPHFHIPLQAGSNSVLKKMHRKYERELFADRVYRIKEKFPNSFIAADLIVGFPTETKEDFEDAYNFIKDLPISGLHIFSYSPRPEAKSFDMPIVYLQGEKEARSKILHKLSEEKKEEFYKQCKNMEVDVLWEDDKISYNGKEYMLGYSENYIKVACLYDRNKINTISKVVLNQYTVNDNKDLVYNF